MNTYNIVVTGCQMNKADSERLASYLESFGYIFEVDVIKADVVVLVTCGVRQSAENRIYTLAPKIKQDNPNTKLVLTGCLSAREDVKKRLKDSVDIWLDIVDLPLLASKLGQSVALGSNEGYLSLNAKHESAFSAYVPIGNGCNNFCAYCVVPYARGRETYRPHEEIIAEVEKLIAGGYKEIILIAQNVNSYTSPVIPAEAGIQAMEESDNRLDSRLRGNDKGENGNDNLIDFADLITMIDNLEGDFWIRFATSHPKDLNDKLITTVAGSKKVCPHWHIALQSGDDEILRVMNRKYTAKHYLDIVNKIRLATPQASITTDVIVGFPGETEAQFQHTNDLIKQISFDQVFISQYSPRPNTASAKMIDDVGVEDKKQREQILDKTLKDSLIIKNKDLIGQEITILVDRQDEKYAYGRSADFKLVRFATQDNYLGRFVTLIITGKKFFSFTGEIKKSRI
jgi:tRNA-2-methylthio-N6-dimethylallyladenosine synthase